MKKRLLASLTALCLLVGLFPTAAMAADPGDSEGVVSGSGTQLDPWVISADGEDNNVKAYLEETGNVINAIYGEAIKLSAGQSYVLHIFGEGAMKDFTITNAGADGTPATDTRPWAEKADQIVEIVMEENVTSIGDRAFQNLTELTTANIPASITDLGDHIFQGDISLTTVEWASGFTAPSITGTDSNHETYTGAYVPTSMFDGCTSLGESLELNEWLPSSFTGVGCAAFRGTAFSVDFDSWDNLAYIGTYGFASMPNLESITITEKYTFGLRGTNEICGAFQGSGLTSVTIQSGLKSILRSMFDGGESLSSFTLSNDVKTIKSYALRGTTALKSIDLNCVETIDTYAFDGSGLETLTLPQGTTKVDSRAFRNCADLDTLTINSSDVDIESMAFAGCTSLESVTTGASTDVTFNNAFAADGDSFGACTSVTELIAEGKLAGNITALTSLKRLSMDSESAMLNAPATFPAVDTLIVTGDSWQVKNYAFANTNKMGDLVVSVGSVTSAENANSGFRKNTSLESVQFTGSAVTLQQDMFNACSNLNWIDLSQVDNLTFGNKCFGSSSTSGWEGQFNSNCVIYVADGTDGTAARTNTGLTDSTGIVLITNGGTVDVEQAEPGFAAVTKDNAAAQWYEYNAEEENGYSGEQVTTPEAGKTYIAIWDEDTDVEVTTTEEEDSSDPADASTSEETSSTVPVQPADPTAEELADDETAKKEPAKEDPPLWKRKRPRMSRRRQKRMFLACPSPTWLPVIRSILSMQTTNCWGQPQMVKRLSAMTPLKKV